MQPRGGGQSWRQIEAFICKGMGWRLPPLLSPSSLGLPVNPKCLLPLLFSEEALRSEPSGTSRSVEIGRDLGPDVIGEESKHRGVWT